MLVPEGNEDTFDLIVETISETDWAQPLKPLQANKDLFYSYFGQVPKASAVTKTEVKAEGGDVEMIKT